MVLTGGALKPDVRGPVLWPRARRTQPVVTAKGVAKDLSPRRADVARAVAVTVNRNWISCSGTHVKRARAP